MEWLQKVRFLFELCTPFLQDRVYSRLLMIAFINNILDGHFPFLKTHRLFLFDFGVGGGVGVCVATSLFSCETRWLSVGFSSGVGGLTRRMTVAGWGHRPEFERLRAVPGVNGSFGFTPYFRRLARPHGQPPKVTSISMAWRNRARRWPRLALVQIGQPYSQ